MIVINTPNNPTASVFSAEDLRMLEGLLKDTNIVVVSDEVYEHIIFDGLEHQSMARHDALAARSFIVGSFGKTYHTTGWKVGYAVAPAQLTAEFRKVHQFVTFSTNTPVQHAIAELRQLASRNLIPPAGPQPWRFWGDDVDEEGPGTGALDVRLEDARNPSFAFEDEAPLLQVFEQLPLFASRRVSRQRREGLGHPLFVALERGRGGTVALRRAGRDLVRLDARARRGRVFALEGGAGEKRLDAIGTAAPAAARRAVGGAAAGQRNVAPLAGDGVAAGAVRAAASEGSALSGRGRRRAGRDGGRRRRPDPLQARSAEDQEREPGKMARARSRDQVLPAGRAARHLHAVSLPDRADAGTDHVPA